LKKDWRDAEADFNDYCKPPKPTLSELRLREILKKNKFNLNLIKLFGIQVVIVLHQI
jgi:hypothetical protein